MLRRHVLSLLAMALLVAGLVPVSADAGPRGTAACSAPLTLQLAANRDNPFVQAVPVPPGMPPTSPGVVVVHVPLYPGATTTPPPATPLTPTTTLTPTTALLSVPLTAYLKTALAIYRLPAAPTTASVWYQSHFARCGYTASETGWAGTTLFGLSFTTPARPNLTVELSFQTLPNGQTLLVYLAFALTIPPRPAGSYLPADMTAVTITYTGTVRLSATGYGAKALFVRTIRDPGWLHRLVAAINGPLPLDAGVHTCLPLDYSARLVFRERNGRTIDVYANPSCGNVIVGSSPPLVDADQRVWTTITALLFPAGTPTPPAPFPGGPAAPPSATATAAPA